MKACAIAVLLAFVVSSSEAAKGRRKTHKGESRALPVSLSTLQGVKFKDASRTKKTATSLMAFYDDLGFSYMASYRGEMVTALQAIYDLRIDSNNSMRALFNFHANTLGLLHPDANFPQEVVSAMFDQCEPEIKAVYRSQRPKGSCSFKGILGSFRRDETKFYLEYRPGLTQGLGQKP